MFSAINPSGCIQRLARNVPSVLRNASANRPALRSISSRTSIHSSQASNKAIVPNSWRSHLVPAGGRGFSATRIVKHEHVKPPAPGKEIWITFVDKDGMEHKIATAAGDNLLSIAQTHDIEMEGACEGSCACSTCHIIVESEEMYDKMTEPSDDENDMLDLAFGLTETSRLGCQCEMSKELDGLRVKLPNATRNMQASNFTSK